ncbi:hypothetical protein SAMN04489740_1022 [Arthrobacter alpinus]|uniref:Uncharacterized protein n=1 Tax=Arthrobacter alpinus TaxID=656366 RepID=A0A1H5HHZ5_9MICC|nr:hypothetical protein SAMN04489740_1022 [Arthrobacter alpinus]
MLIIGIFESPGDRRGVVGVLRNGVEIGQWVRGEKLNVTRASWVNLAKIGKNAPKRHSNDMAVIRMVGE